mmetsp:Transcript_4079/g.18095  ORF Transcript_4079/g.18095 Transcript_4079/m.18095 type:complete len:412 (+) Transcript_4079:2710-3945(+)
MVFSLNVSLVSRNRMSLIPSGSSSPSKLERGLVLAFFACLTQCVTSDARSASDVFPLASPLPLFTGPPGTADTAFPAPVTGTPSVTLFSLARLGLKGDADAVIDDARPAPTVDGAESADRTADVAPAGLASFLFAGWYLLIGTMMSPAGVDTTAVVGSGAFSAVGSSTMVLAISSSVGNGRSSLGAATIVFGVVFSSPASSISPFSGAGATSANSLLAAAAASLVMMIPPSRSMETNAPLTCRRRRKPCGSSLTELGAGIKPAPTPSPPSLDSLSPSLPFSHSISGKMVGKRWKANTRFRMSSACSPAIRDVPTMRSAGAPMTSPQPPPEKHVSRSLVDTAVTSSSPGEKRPLSCAMIRPCSSAITPSMPAMDESKHAWDKGENMSPRAVGANEFRYLDREAPMAPVEALR